MARRHRKSAEYDRGALSDPVPEPAADDGREIDEARVKAENLRSERLGRERPERPDDPAAKGCKSSDVLDMARDVMRHRLVLSFEAHADDITPDAILTQILDRIPIPAVPHERRPDARVLTA